MNSFMHFKKLMVLVLLLSSAASTASASAAWLSQIHPLEDAVVTETPDADHSLIIQAINQAQNSVQMWMYHLTDADVIQALIQARSRGVYVQVILDSGSMKNQKYADVQTQLTSGSVEAVASSSAFRLTHTKTFVVDGNLAFISTMNLVGHYQGTSAMRDYGLFTRDPQIIQELNSVFTADLANAQSNSMNTPSLSNANLVWSPVNSAQKLSDLIDSAQQTVYATVENIGQTDVSDALTRAAARGVKVYIITPECDLNSNPAFNYPVLRTMMSSGVVSRVMPTPSSNTTPYMHAKIIIVDQRIAFMGSENYSYSSLNMSRETGVIFSSANAIQSVMTVFAKDWSNTIEMPSGNPVCPQQDDN